MIPATPVRPRATWVTANMLGLPLWAALGILLVWATALGDRHMLGAAALFLANWGIARAVYLAAGVQFDWKVNCAVDWFTASLLLAAIPGRMSAVLVVTLVTEIFFAHFKYALSPRTNLDQIDYWYAMHYTVWAQVGVLCARGVHGTGGFIRGGKFLAPYRRFNPSFLSRGRH
jgi:hypothetical protein